MKKYMIKRHGGTLVNTMRITSLYIEQQIDKAMRQNTDIKIQFIHDEINATIGKLLESLDADLETIFKWINKANEEGIVYKVDRKVVTQYVKDLKEMSLKDLYDCKVFGEQLKITAEQLRTSLTVSVFHVPSSIFKITVTEILFGIVIATIVMVIKPYLM